MSSSSIAQESEPLFHLIDIDGDSEYYGPESDTAILHSISPHIVNLKELIMTHIRHKLLKREISSVDKHDVTARRTFMSDKRHKALSAESIVDLCCIGP